MVACGHKPNSVSRPTKVGMTIIHLGSPLPTTSSTLPALMPRTMVPGSSCFRRRAACACTRWGLPCPDCHQSSGALLPHLFTLTPLLNRYRPRRDLQRPFDIDLVAGRYIFCGTVPSLATRPVGVTHHRVLWCSDFPPSKTSLSQRSSVHVRSIGRRD